MEEFEDINQEHINNESVEQQIKEQNPEQQVNQTENCDGEQVCPECEEQQIEEQIPNQQEQEQTCESSTQDEQGQEQPDKEQETTIAEEEAQPQEEKEEPADETKNNTANSSKALADEYLNLARVIQADFDNYRRRSFDQIERARVDGIASTVEVLLPSLDAFKKAKETIKDENTLEGINMLERAIISSLEKLGVEKIQAVGLPLDPNIHNVLAVTRMPNYEDGVVVEEFQAGYRLKDKIIRCSQVLVNKLD